MATTAFFCSTKMMASSSSLMPSSIINPSSPLSSKRPPKLLPIKASANTEDQQKGGRKLAAISIAAVLMASAASALPHNANAGIVEDLLAKSQANKELNDKKRLATSGANVARAYTVAFGTCQFPYNFTGCQDLAKKKNVPFLTDDLKLECEGKEKYKCGSNVFWQW